MDAPLCRLCNTKHWSAEPHALKEPVVNKVVNADNAVVNKTDRGRDRHADKEGRKVYLREYMRRRRGAAR